MPNLWLNPAMTGFIPHPWRVVLAYRNQWQAITPYPYRTFMGSVDVPVLTYALEPDHLGLGLMVMEDRAGHSRLGFTEALVSAAYHRALNDDPDHPAFLGTGLQIGYGIRGFETDLLLFGSQFTIYGPDPDMPSGEAFVNTSVSYIDINAGLWTIFTIGDKSTWFAGVSGYHLNNPSTHFYEQVPLYRRLTAYAGGIIDVADRSSVILSALHLRQYRYEEYTVGLGWLYYPWTKAYGSGYRGRSRSIMLGMWYRWEDAIFPAFRYDTKHFTFGLSYDITLSSLRVANQMRGGIEVFLAFYGLEIRTRSKYKAIYCPKIGG